MQNEIRYYLGLIQQSIKEGQVFTHIVTAVRLPTGAIEIAINTENIPEKVQYILDAYDDDMHLITNQEVQLKNVMII